MGLNTAIGLAESFDLDQAILIHLQSNHYPPVPASMVQTCIEAIDAYYEDDYDKMIVLPEGVLWKGRDQAPASALIEAHHLEAWLPETDY
jgi:hypothetical protein